MESNATSNSTTYSTVPIGFAYYIVCLLILLVSLFGMVGNGIVICILGCCLKRNPFTIYILNLSIADFGVLMTLETIYICWILHPTGCALGVTILLYPLFLFTFSTSQFLLAAISMDRCVCLFFPLWHKCQRPPHLSAIFCVVIWILTFLMSTLINSLRFALRSPDLPNYQFLLNTLIFPPAIFISTIAMWIKVYFMSSHHKRGKLSIAILLALVFFLIFAFPMNVTQLFFTDHIPTSSFLLYYAPVGATLNSAINPVIYFLVGREKRAKGGIRKIFEKLFQEEESCKEVSKSSLTTRL